MNDLLTDRQTDELTESEAATLFGGGPAFPPPCDDPLECRPMTREEAERAIRADMDPALFHRPDADKLIRGWAISVSLGDCNIRMASNSLNRNLADNYGED